MQGHTLSQRTRVRAPAPRGAPPTSLRSTSVATSTHRSRPAHRRAGADQRPSQATHFMAFIAAAFMAFLAKPFASAFPTFMAFIAAAFMAFLAKVPFASVFTTFMAFIAAAFMAFLAKVPFAWVFTAFIAFIAGAAAFFIAFAMARREVDEDTGTTQST